MDPISNTKKMIPSGTYAGRELLSIVEGMVELNQFEVDDQVIKTNKLKGITEMIINLDELNNSDNLKDRRPSNELLIYHMTDDKDFMHFEPDIPQHRKLKNGEFTSLILRITDQNNNIITDGLQVKRIGNGDSRTKLTTFAIIFDHQNHQMPQHLILDHSFNDLIIYPIITSQQSPIVHCTQSPIMDLAA